MSLVLDYSNGVFAAKPTGGSLGTDPSTIGDANFADVSLLLHGDGTSGSTIITDSSSNAVVVTANGNAQIDTAVKKFGTGSIEFDGTGDYLTLGSGTPNYPNFGTGPFTIEMWIYNTTSGSQALFNTHRAGVSSGMYFSINTNNALVHGSFGNGDNGNNITANNVISLNTWHHIALCREGTGTNQTKIFVDGTAVLTYTDASNYASYTYGPYLASYDVGGTTAEYTGYIDDLRVTSGIARYTSNFTPPTAAFLNSGPTLDLSSGTYFNYAPSANTTFAFANPPASGTAAGFALAVTPSATVTLTYPASVEWPSGTAPDAPASGETDVLVFLTDDGGTSYQGFQAGDAMS